MSMTNELRKLVRTMIKQATSLDSVFYETADNADMYPHVTFSINSVDLLDLNRQDYRIDVDVWCRDANATQAENLSDSICKAFNASNKPQDTLLPTFFLESRRTVLDEDKLIRHKQIVFIAQSYEVQNG